MAINGRTFVAALIFGTVNYRYRAMGGHTRLIPLF
jgi:hypothetical protein